MRLIDADALPVRRLTVIKRVIKDRLRREYCLVDAVLYEAIKNAPAIDAEPVQHGRWIKKDAMDEWYGPVVKCDLCGEMVLDMAFEFCPYCGAKMEQPEGEEKR